LHRIGGFGGCRKSRRGENPLRLSDMERSAVGVRRWPARRECGLQTKPPLFPSQAGMQVWNKFLDGTCLLQGEFFAGEGALALVPRRGEKSGERTCRKGQTRRNLGTQSRGSKFRGSGWGKGNLKSGIRWPGCRSRNQRAAARRQKPDLPTVNCPRLRRWKAAACLPGRERPALGEGPAGLCC